MSVDPSTAIKTGLALWDQRHGLKTLLRILRRRLGQGKMVIAVFGAGGVGKTTLGVMLSEEFDPQEKPPEYKESLDSETYWLKSNPTKSVIVAPGQELRIESYWPQVLEQLSRAKTAVVIHVVAYGYHSFSAAQTLVEREGVVQDYLAERRRREIEILGQLAGYLKNTARPLKMLTLVTKQDLWWNEREEVRRHFENSEYEEQIARIRATKGHQHFVHEFGYASLYLHNLKTGDGRVIANTTAGYDDELRLGNQQRVFEIITGFAK